MSSGSHGGDRFRRDDERPARGDGRGGSARGGDQPPYRGDRDSRGGPGERSGFAGGGQRGGYGGDRAGRGGDRREGGFRGGDRREGGYRPARREGPERRDEGSRGRDEGYRGRGEREGGFRPERREGGFRPERREGGFRPERREGGFRPERRDEGYRGRGEREGGFRPERREGGYRGREEGYRGRDDRRDRFERPARAREEERPEAPVLPDEIVAADLDKDVRAELLSLAKPVAETVARHLVATGHLIDEDPQAALAHALAARRLASRIAAVREAVGLAAYRAGDWQAAIAELRTYHRMTGRQTHLAILADCERALGRPERAIDLFRGADREALDQAAAIELLIVAAGARSDLGQNDAAVAMLQVRELTSGADEPWAARLRYAYADALLKAGRREEAREWFARAADADTDAETDAADRLLELDGVVLEGDDEDLGEDLDEDLGEDAVFLVDQGVDAYEEDEESAELEDEVEDELNREGAGQPASEGDRPGPAFS